MIYATAFRLSYPIAEKDFETAREFLEVQNQNVSQYLASESRVSLAIKSKISYIRWELNNCQFGTVLVATTEPVTNYELNKISIFISGQNSDGIGCAFSKEEFCNVTDEDGVTRHIEFDYLDNDYTLRPIENLTSNSLEDAIYATFQNM